MLKSLNFSELEFLSAQLSQWSGAELQSIAGSEKELGLRFNRDDKGLVLWVDLDARAPMALLFDRYPVHRKKTKPLHLFLRSNFVGAVLEGACVTLDKGRVLLLSFSDGREFEIRLFPHGQNLIARANQKQLSWGKIKELGQSQLEKKEESVRSLEEMREQWISFKKSGGEKSKKDPVKQIEKDIQKKKKALEKILSADFEAENKLLQELGEWLKSFGVSDFPDNVPPKWRDFVDREQSLSKNIESCFAKIAKNQAKLGGRQERTEILKKEIEELTAKLSNPKSIKAPEKKVKGLLEEAGVRGRTRRLDGGIEGVIGKSARDNMALLRRAKPWFYWLHLKDEPSAYVIVRRNRGQKVPQEALRELALWLVAETPSLNLRGKFEVLLCECRHVRPIKGDKMGRVNYQNAQTLSVSAD